MKQAVPEGAKCRSFGCSRKATTVIKDSKGRRQYCCDNHNGSKQIKEKSK